MKLSMKKMVVMPVIIILFLGVSLQACAHNLWLALDHYDQRVGDTARVFMYLAHSIPFADLALPEKMNEFYYITPSGNKKEFVLRRPDSESFFNEVSVPLPLGEEGTYVAVAAMRPVFVTLTPQGRKRQSKKRLPDAISCRHVEFFAKAIFRAGEPGGTAYKTVLGHVIEMIPQKDPCLLKTGDYLPIKVMFKGKPLAGEFVYATYIGFSTREDYAFATGTDGEGMARIKILRPGIWWLKVPYKGPHKDKTECDVDQYATILTFEVK